MGMLEILTTVFSYTLLAVFAQNLFFCGGIGVDVVLRLIKHPKRLFGVALLTTLFSSFTAIEKIVIELLIGVLPMLSRYAIPLMLLMQLLICVAAVAGMRAIDRQKTQVLRGVVPSAAFSNIVVMIGMAGRLVDMSIPQILGYSVGTGIAFLLTAFFMEAAINKIGNKDMNKAFLGVPSLLIYMGILAMAFVGITGVPISFG